MYISRMGRSFNIIIKKPLVEKTNHSPPFMGGVRGGSFKAFP